MWRVLLDRLPIRTKLEERRLDLDSTLCPICHGNLETTPHIFFQCSLAVQVWNRVANWLASDIPTFSSAVNMVEWIDSRPVVRMERVIIDFIFKKHLGSLDLPKYGFISEV